MLLIQMQMEEQDRGGRPLSRGMCVHRESQIHQSRRAMNTLKEDAERDNSEEGTILHSRSLNTVVHLTQDHLRDADELPETTSRHPRHKYPRFREA
jgi:hypothetical protein